MKNLLTNDLVSSIRNSLHGMGVRILGSQMLSFNIWGRIGSLWNRSRGEIYRLFWHGLSQAKLSFRAYCSRIWSSQIRPMLKIAYWIRAWRMLHFQVRLMLQAEYWVSLGDRLLYRLWTRPWANFLATLRIKRWLITTMCGSLLTLSVLPTHINVSAVNTERGALWGIEPQMIATEITEDIAVNQFPQTIKLPDFPISDSLSVRYTIDPALQEETKRLLRKHNPDYGMVVALDPESGRVLAMADTTRHDSFGNMNITNQYPAASVSKIVTAVAAINENKLTADTVIPFNGKRTSLYKKHVFRHRDHRWTRKYSFRKSFALSVNSVFGRVGSVDVGGATMLDYAERLGFNRQPTSDFGFDYGTIKLDSEDIWEVAETASGYTLRNKLSALHGAALAATAVNGGNLVTPNVVEEIIGPNGVPLYWNTQSEKSSAMSTDTAEQLKKMMHNTVRIGSARSSFYNFNRGKLKNAVVGGKTGSLTGFSPKGKYDWFVGFGEVGERKIAFAVLCINKKFWFVKSTQLAREVLDFYFRNPPSSSPSPSGSATSISYRSTNDKKSKG